MSIRSGLIVAGLVGAAFVAGRFAPPGGAVSIAQAQPEGDPQMDAMMAAMQPGEAHKALEVMLGTWEGDVKFWMAPDTEPMVSHGKATRQWILDGRFVEEKVEAEMMGGVFHGLGLVGYNTLEKRYESFWAENMATWMSMATGTYDPAKKTFEFTGEMLDPMTGKRQKQRTTVDCSNPNREVMIGHCTGPDGKTFKNFEGVFEKRN